MKAKDLLPKRAAPARTLAAGPTRRYSVADRMDRFDARRDAVAPDDLAAVMKGRIGRLGGYDVMAFDEWAGSALIDDDLTTGANPGRYRYTLLHQIWVGSRQVPEYQCANVVHEGIECALMVHRRLTYDKAHDIAKGYSTKASTDLWTGSFRLNGKDPATAALDWMRANIPADLLAQVQEVAA